MIIDKMKNLVGKTAPEVYTGMISNLPAIQGISLAQYSLPPTIQKRAHLSEQESCLVESAARARKTKRLSYLEILLEMSLKADHPVDGILDAVCYHQQHSRNRIFLSRKEVLQGQLIKFCEKAVPNTLFAFLSKVKIDSSSFRHIPLLDLHVEKSKQSLDIVRSIAKRLLDSPYAILETARSFHLVGIRLLTQKQAKQFLSKAILFSPITDHAYIAHQLLEGESALRITGCGKSVDLPTLVMVG